MSLSETSVLQVAKAQYLYKFKTYANLLLTLVAVQVLALLSALGGEGMSGTGGPGLTINVLRVSGDYIIVYTLLWAFGSAIMCTTSANKDADFTFVSNRLSSNLSNIGFLLTSAVLAGVMAALSQPLLRLMLLLTLRKQNIAVEYFFIPPQDLLLAIIPNVLYISLVSALGYLFGTLVQVNKAFAIILPLLAMAAFRVSGLKNALILGFIQESSLALFALKVICAVALMFWASCLITNRLEVRR